MSVEVGFGASQVLLTSHALALQLVDIFSQRGQLSGSLSEVEAR